MKSSLGKEIVLTDKGNTNIIGYYDDAGAEDESDRTSTSGYRIFIDGNINSRESKKHNIVAGSSTEVRHQGMAHATYELLWLKHLLQKLQFCEVGPMELVCDNQSDLHLSSNPIFLERTKHIKFDCHFIRENILSIESSEFPLSILRINLLINLLNLYGVLGLLTYVKSRMRMMYILHLEGEF
jgi:hypothetical protein